MPLPPACFDVAADFSHDCRDLLRRYKITIDEFSAIRSKRLKCFIDLRMATECILKAYAAYYLMTDLPREKVLKKIENYGHKVKTIANRVGSHIAPEHWSNLEPFIEQLQKLPVGLRYRLDVFDFRDENEDLYYETVGDDDWLDDLHDAISAVANDFRKLPEMQPQIIPSSDLYELALAHVAQHNKYAKK